MNWIDIRTETPTTNDIGKEFLVAVKNSVGIDYEVAEWYLFDEEDGAYFAIKTYWSGQQTVNRKTVYWCEIPELPNE